MINNELQTLLNTYKSPDSTLKSKIEKNPVGDNKKNEFENFYQQQKKSKVLKRQSKVQICNSVNMQ